VECLAVTGGVLYIRFIPWMDVPLLIQGLTVKRSGGMGEDWEKFKAGMRSAGFDSIQTLKQVHGARVIRIARPDSGKQGEISPGLKTEADGMVSGVGNILGTVTVADCVPVFLLDRVSGAWGLVHAGWRSIASGILQETLKAMNESLDIPAYRIEIYFGPAICGSCYEVGPEVAARLLTGAVNPANNSCPGKVHIDLRDILARQARWAGVPAASIYTSHFCTRCHNYLFHSYRTEGISAGKMWAFMGSTVPGSFYRP